MIVIFLEVTASVRISKWNVICDREWLNTRHIRSSIPVLIISKEISTPFSCLRLRECCRPMKWSRKCLTGEPENRFAQQFPAWDCE